MTASRRPRTLVWLVTAAVLVASVGAWFLLRGRDGGLPRPGSAAYEEVTRHFYRGLAGLQVGLLEAAIDDFTRAIDVTDDEPASWANLGLTHLRLGDFEAAAPAIERAAALAPSSSGIAFLQSRLEVSRGNRDAGLVHLRRAVDLDPANLPARMALVSEIEDAAGPDADAEAQRLLEVIAREQPDNVPVLVERARLAAKRGDDALLDDSLTRVESLSADWPPEVIEQFRLVQQAAAGSGATDAALEIAFLRNVLARVPAFLEGRRRVIASAELVAEPFARFVRMVPVENDPAPADRGLHFVTDIVAGPRPNPWQVLLPMSLDGEQPPTLFVTDGAEIVRVNSAAAPLPFPGGAGGAALPADSLAAVDWNHDFRLDLVAAGPAGVFLFLQAEDGSMVDATAHASQVSGNVETAAGVWVADIEMDGDMDLVVGRRDQAPAVLRNNGEGQWQPFAPFAGVTGLRSFTWGDLDDDGDPDAALVDGSGTLHIFMNLQAGEFRRGAGPVSATALAGMALADVNGDGILDLVTIDTGGAVRVASWSTSGWSETTWTTWADAPGAGDVRLVVADLDNNGAVDLVASADTATAAWLSEGGGTLVPLDADIPARIGAVVDLDGDGLLDMAGLIDGQPSRLTARASRDYHYQVVRPRAQTAAGDQRVNTFGIGGLVEVRSGLLAQRQVIAGPVVHVGLGTRTTVDVTRIVWPNGVPQAEFDPVVDASITAEQRLKGSCPWIFADNGEEMAFVTDFLWRSPLGLRINAQDTAGTTQTEDWVKIRGDQLAPRHGAYDIRISAELWETHFFDHVSLLVVDHPDDVEIFVDERFVPGRPPALAVHATRAPVPVSNVTDHNGHDVTGLVAARDGRYLSTFARGPYQGIAEPHFVEFDVTTSIDAGRASWIVAQGWVYPTDSSINVAIAQGGHVRPQSLSLEALDTSGRWVTVSSDLGFPAGKHKTVLIDLRPVAAAGLGEARRLRLRTNLEIYWDMIATAEPADGSELRQQRLDPAVADLRYRGYSQTSLGRRDLPEIPAYDRLANTAPRWRDLVGYYTRFGDVRELLASIEDRYVIMNAGDELRLSFPAPPEPDAGWTRDFVLIGDGWVKDGDYNTSYSKTVLPLPTHERSDYVAGPGGPSLSSDPVYQRHRDDWRHFHTRYVTPGPFVTGLRQAAGSNHP